MIVALYARVSTVKQAEKDLSIPDQLRQMQDWCRHQGHRVAVEYIEREASATDDRRAEFQKMIAEACAVPPPFEAIVIHSQSRFFRDALEFALYERRLQRAGVRLISITQQTGDDPAGQMARRIFSIFDEYNSKENRKHTLRAMQENARQGYFNGSTPPLGFRTVEVESQGNKGKKKRLAVHPAETAVVQKVFDLYLHGAQGRIFGVQGLAAHLNQCGVTVRGGRWTKGRIHEVLANRVYIGEYYFNKCYKRMGPLRQLKPLSEWVLIKVEPILSEEVFAQAQQLLASRSLAVVSPRVVNSPTLLTGLLRCGQCGARMTLATGKSGQYRYYKCANRITNGSVSCVSGNLPMDKLDRLVLEALADRVFIPGRVRAMLEALRKRLSQARTSEDAQIKHLTHELKSLQDRLDKLYGAVEQGLLPMDATLTERAHKLQAQRQTILTEIAGLRRHRDLPQAILAQKHIQAFCDTLRAKLLDQASGFGKAYLKLLVEEIRCQGKEIHLRGSCGALAQAVGESKLGIPDRVPRFGLDWLSVLDEFRNFCFMPNEEILELHRLFVAV